ncbi:MAG: hypothetical protein IJ083_16545 [Clostridia bacterium]|nr:hypothetical protein [Clostridia bacterium]
MAQSRNRSTAHHESLRLAFCGTIIALSVVLLLTSALIPIMTYAAPLLSGLVLIPVLLSYGKKDAWMTWMATASLALFLGFEKEMALFYLFFGYWPILKWQVDKIRSKPLRMLVKFFFFSLSLLCMYGLLTLLFPLNAILGEFEEMGVALTIAFFAAMILCLFLYDYLLTPLTMTYVTRWEPKLKKMLHIAR